jgi:hypothetical protein
MAILASMCSEGSSPGNCRIIQREFQSPIWATTRLNFGRSEKPTVHRRSQGQRERPMHSTAMVECRTLGRGNTWRLTSPRTLRGKKGVGLTDPLVHAGRGVPKNLITKTRCTVHLLYKLSELEFSKSWPSLLGPSYPKVNLGFRLKVKCPPKGNEEKSNGPKSYWHDLAKAKVYEKVAKSSCIFVNDKISAPKLQGTGESRYTKK